VARKKRKDVDGQLNFAFEPEPGKGKNPAGSSGESAKSSRAMSKKSPKNTSKSSKTRVESKNAVEEAAPKKRAAAAKSPVAHIKDENIEAQAKSMASNQREISVSEFFAKNRHLLGFDNPSKALLTAVKEAVDNSLDACEEAHILPELEVGVKQTGESRYVIWVQDNGPGIVKDQIPNIFGRLLYGSKFHTLRMARGQQGIGISAAGMYGLLTTGKNIKISSKTGPQSQAHYYELRIDTKKNRPDIIENNTIEWDVRSGTRVEIELEARYQQGRQSVDEYLRQTAITNPHTRIRYIMPDGQECIYERSVNQVVEIPKAIKPHPYGVELGVLMKMAKDTSCVTMTSFLTNEFSRVSSRISGQILEKAGISSRTRPSRLSHQQAEKLYQVINETKIMAPSTNCIVPIGESGLLKGLEQVVEAGFYTVCTRPPAVYRGNPFQIEVALAYGNENDNANGSKDEEDNNNDEKELMRVLRFANRVPLLYQQSACCIYKSIMQTNWRLYGLSQSKGALPSGAVTVIVHIASVWVPFTSESKEAVAHYPEIIKEIKLGLADCGRQLGRHLRGVKRQHEEAKKQSYIKKYLPAIGEALQDILALKDQQVRNALDNLAYMLEHSRKNKPEQ